MLFFGHIGITIGAVDYVNRKFRYNVDLRKAGLLAIAADLIDKPIGLLYKDVFRNHTRLLGHTLLFSILLLAAFWMSGKKHRLKYPFLLWCCYFGHMLLDRIWEHNLSIFFWPFWGSLPSLEEPILHRWHDALFRPYTIFGEVTGVLLLIYVVVRHRLNGGNTSGEADRSIQSD